MSPSLLQTSASRLNDERIPAGPCGPQVLPEDLSVQLCAQQRCTSG
ncbi:hypothetical protein HOU26_gp44 [Escherichia phage IMM-002]|uniref:Uncharacterized protein n=1 Tax=Escherichia phage IMM-002 TaxID=2041760 RepID=A0A384WII3_9CAUD|nr:hypothetical protein HOU26_gp44 [Escherichia phage IMM-002]ATI17003.1 hypothetical protein [Escherichia phage IMM-002]